MENCEDILCISDVGALHGDKRIAVLKDAVRVTKKKPKMRKSRKGWKSLEMTSSKSSILASPKMFEKVWGVKYYVGNKRKAEIILRCSRES